MQHLNVQPDECVFIEETAENIEVVSGMGMKGVFADDPVEMQEALEKSGVLGEGKLVDK